MEMKTLVDLYLKHFHKLKVDPHMLLNLVLQLDDGYRARW